MSVKLSRQKNSNIFMDVYVYSYKNHSYIFCPQLLMRHKTVCTQKMKVLRSFYWQTVTTMFYHLEKVCIFKYNLFQEYCFKYKLVCQHSVFTCLHVHMSCLLCNTDSLAKLLYIAFIYYNINWLMMISNDSLQLLKKPSMTVPFLNGPSVRESMVSVCPLAL